MSESNTKDNKEDVVMKDNNSKDDKNNQDKEVINLEKVPPVAT